MTIDLVNSLSITFCLLIPLSILSIHNILLYYALLSIIITTDKSTGLCALPENNGRAYSFHSFTDRVNNHLPFWESVV